jgi:hypothetical protein
MESGKPIMMKKTASSGDIAAARAVDRMIRESKVRADKIDCNIF